MQIILDGLKLAGHGNQSIDKLRKKYSGVSGEYKHLQKLHPILIHIFKNQKADMIVCKHSNRVQEFIRHTKENLLLTCHLEIQKATG